MKAREEFFAKPKGEHAPRRRGRFYCAPSCSREGFCLAVEFDRATRRAAVLAARLGPGWRPRVHENLGWHFEVRSPCGRVAVYDHRHKARVSYSVLIGGAWEIGGRWVGRGSTPEAAVADGRRKMEEELATIGAAVADFPVPVRSRKAAR